jgi:hypothetical protein
MYLLGKLPVPPQTHAVILKTILCFRLGTFRATHISLVGNTNLYSNPLAVLHHKIYSQLHTPLNPSSSFVWHIPLCICVCTRFQHIWASRRSPLFAFVGVCLMLPIPPLKYHRAAVVGMQRRQSSRAYQQLL